MAKDLPTTSYAVLGLLSIRPMSGHALSSLADKSIAYFWSIPRSLVYRELVRLEQLGYLSGTDVAQPRLPDKRQYELTPSGRTELARWLNQPGFEQGRSKDGFLVKFFFGDLMEPSSRRRLLYEYRREAEAHRDDLRAIAAKLERAEGAGFRRLTALRGIRAAEGQLLWLDDVEEAFAKDSNSYTAEAIKAEIR